MEGERIIARMENDNRSEKDFQAQETEGEEVAMICWEEPNEKTGVEMEEPMTIWKN